MLGISNGRFEIIRPRIRRWVYSKLALLFSNIASFHNGFGESTWSLCELFVELGRVDNCQLLYWLSEGRSGHIRVGPSFEEF